MSFLCIVVDLNVPVNNIRSYRVLPFKGKDVSFALLSSYKIFRTAVNITAIKSSYKVTVIFETNFWFLLKVFLSVHNIEFYEHVFIGSSAAACGRTGEYK